MAILPGVSGTIGFSVPYPPEYANYLDANARTNLIDPVLLGAGLGGTSRDNLWLEGMNFADQFTVTVQAQGGSVLATLTNDQATILIDNRGDQVLSFTLSNPSALNAVLIVEITNLAYGTKAELTINPSA